MAQVIITGQVSLAEAGTPLPNIKIELWDKTTFATDSSIDYKPGRIPKPPQPSSIGLSLILEENGYGWIATTVADIDGNFTLILNDPFATMIVNGDLNLVYRAYKNNILITEQTISDYTDPVNISIEDATYDALFSDDCEETFECPYLTVKGNLYDANMSPLNGNIIVNVYESGFRQQFLLASGQFLLGEYLIKINTKLITNTTVIANRTIVVQATDDQGNVLASSQDIRVVNDVLVVNLISAGTNNVSEFDNISNMITQIIGQVPIASLQIIPEKNVNEVRYVALAIGESEKIVQNVVYAYQLAAATQLEESFFYAMLTVGGKDIYTYLFMTSDAINTAIQNAMKGNIIDFFDSPDITAFIQGIQVYQLQQIKTYGVAGETYQFIDVLNSIFTQPQDIDNFLIEYSNEYNSLTDFWTAYTADYGQDLANLAQLGLQLAAITCYQPQTISAIITQLGQADITTLASWDLDTWMGLVGTTCRAANLLCVPASIRGTETDPGNVAIQQQYAARLMGITQSLYPMGYILAQLNGDSGGSLIPDPNVRALVVAFLTQNPDFDVRVQTVNSINQNNFDLSNITDDPSQIISGLSPFQRILRVVGGNPVAGCTLIIAGIDSAKSISAMGPDLFSEIYSSLFPDSNQSQQAPASYLLGLAPALPVVYSTAVTIASATKSGLTNAVTAAIASSGITNSVSAMAEKLALKTASLAAPATASPAAYTYPFSYPPVTVPTIPPVFPGGYIPSPTDDPTLSELFGNLDYCSCCDCMSVYSPAAYLSDTLQFLKSSDGSSSSASQFYLALNAKRPDIINIDLTCKNTDTPVPYIDLSIELLELQVLQQNPANIPGGIAAFSFQTSGTADQLAAYPEHMYKNGVSTADYADYTAFEVGSTVAYDTVYDSTNLAGAIYPAILPFILPIEESRTYLQHLGISRFQLMQLFLPFNLTSVPVGTPPPDNQITNYGLYAEWLGVNQFAATIITAQYYYVALRPWLFYGASAETLTPTNGFPDPNGSGTIPSSGSMLWTDAIASRIDVLIQQAGIQYDELLQYLTTSFLNPFTATTRQAYIIAITGYPVDTCELDHLMLQFADPSYVDPFFNKFHRYIRLAKSGKFSIYQWDILFRAMTITDIDNENFQQFGKLLLIGDQLNLPPEVMSMWFNSADTVQYLDYPNGSIDQLPSVYQNIFSSNNVVNNASSNAFIDPTSLPSTYVGYTGQIGNFCGIAENDVIALLNFLQISLSSAITLNILSRLYALAQIAKSNSLTISDFITVINLTDAPPVVTPLPVPVATIIPYDLPDWVAAGGSLDDYLNNIQYLIDTINAIKIAGFSVAEFNYLIADQDPSNIIGPQDETIEIFYESVRTELQKNQLFPLPVTASPTDQTNLLNKLTGILFQHFSKEFNVSLQIVSDIFSVANDSSVVTGNDITNYLLNNDFVTSTYALTTDNIAFIDGLTAGSTVPIPPSAVGSDDKVPDFKLHLLYNWYKYCFKVTFISQRLKLRTAEFEYLYLPQPTTTVDFNFAQLPVCFVPGSTSTLGTYSDAAVTVTLQDAIYGLLRVNHLMDIVSQLAFAEDGLGILLDAVSGIIRPATPGALPIVVGSTDFTNINICFTNLLTLINQDTWGTMLNELIGTVVPSVTTEYTQYQTTPVVYSLLSTLFTMELGTSNYAATSYTNISNILTAINIIYWASRIGLTPTSLQLLLVEDISLDDSRSLIVAAKGKYDDASWGKIAKPLRDVVRVKQRNALVAYMQTPPDSIYQALLIDVEMDPCMMTSRIKQAISSVQLFIDRILLGLESYGGTQLVLPSQMLSEWQEWRKWYGVWEANRKIFFYPEDWLQPELRDDKSIFFQELETQLKQNDVTIDNVQDAMMDYLEKLDDVARLEPVGTCDDPNTGITHVFARTKGASHRYYHRTLTNSIWSSWDRVDIDIPSNNIVPVVYNSRLYLYWLTFKTKQAPVPGSVAAVQEQSSLGGNPVEELINNHYFYNTQDETILDNNGSTPGSAVATTNQKFYYTQIEVTLNWSEYKNGKWQNQVTSKDSMLLKVSPWLQDQIYMHVFNPNYSGSPSLPTIYPSGLPTPDKNEETLLLDYLMNNRMESLVEFMQTRITIFPYVAVDTDVWPWKLDPSAIFSTADSAPVIVGDLYLLINYPSYLNVWTPTTIWTSDSATFIKSFHFSDSSNTMEVTEDVMFIKQTVPPETLYYKNSALVSYPDDNYPSGNTFPGFLNKMTTYDGGVYNYDREIYEGGYIQTAGSTFTILNSVVPNKYRIFPKAPYITSPVEDKFMYEDGINTFFVRYIPTSITISPYYLIGIDTSSAAAGGFYAVSAASPHFAEKKEEAALSTALYATVPTVVKTAPSYPAPNYPGPGFGEPGTAGTGAVPYSGSGGILVVGPPVVVGPGLPSSPGGFSPGSVYFGGSTSFSITPSVTVPISYVADRYLFQTFYHAHVSDFIKILNQYGIDGLMRPDRLGLSPAAIVQTFSDTMDFSGTYNPNTAWVATPYPQNSLDFVNNEAYSIYNWELFFHIPMMMAQRLSENQQFFDAQSWFHYIFDPTSNTNMDGSPAAADTRKYWKFFPFFQIASAPIETMDDLLAAIDSGSAAAVSQVTESGNDPFQPFAIARMRPVAFMKAVLMKYLDNLIAWGDNLFMQDTIESINEATNLYILASNILGEKPVPVPQRAVTASYSFSELPSVDSIGDASVPLETYIDPSPVTVAGTGGSPGSGTNILYFCMAPNDNLLTYWDTVADRLFKIRHCQNISGVTQQLPLFEPPINPALLVSAAASGVDINSVLNDISGVNLPNYRFTYMVQKANEFCADVKALGGSLLAALEKSDGEQLATIRSGQEVAVQNAVMLIKQLQITEAQANIDALNASLNSAQAKYDYYSSRVFMNDSETEYFSSLQRGINYQNAQTNIQEIAHALSLVPQFHGQATFAIGASFGGQQLSTAANMVAAKLAATAAINNIQGSMANTKGGYQRRMDEWQFQASLAQLEITQIGKQIIAANVRLQIAQQDATNQQLLIDNATAIDAFMHTKYTNQDLYDWMIGQISTTYFQAYQLAYNLAKKAEQCYANELPLSTLILNGGFIQPTSWDSLRKGLLAGEGLQYDIRNMENAYMTDNVRLLELTKHVSLANLQPDQLAILKATGQCTITVPEGLYDMDYPGHYNRMIKSVSITIPCVAGPYTTIPCTLSLSTSYVRRDSINVSAALDEIENVPCTSIATSSAQNDNGMFDFSFKDERYLPFEGAGAISTWTLQISNTPITTGTPTPPLMVFNYNTINDVVLHVKYTASDAGASFAGGRQSALIENLNHGYIDLGADILLPRYYSLKHEFPNEWFQFENDFATDPATAALNIPISIDQFPFFCQGADLTITELYFQARMKIPVNTTYSLNIACSWPGSTSPETVYLTGNAPGFISGLTIGGIDAGAVVTISLQFTSGSSPDPVDLDTNLDDLYLVAYYKGV